MILVAVIVAIYIGATRNRRRINTGGHLRNQLTRRLKGDEETAARLIEFERKRQPDASEAQLIRAAIQRLDRDRR